MSVRAVLFDIGGVLERVESPEAWARRWSGRLGWSVAGFETVMGGVDPEGAMGTGAMGEPEFRDRAATALGLDEQGIAEFMNGLWDWYCGELDPDTMAFAADLQARLTVGILSNSGSGAREQEERRHAFSAVFDPILYSHEVGLLKPDPRIYEFACAKLGAEPHEVVLVDDWPVAVEGAREFGMHAVLHTSADATIAAVTRLLDESPAR